MQNVTSRDNEQLDNVLSNPYTKATTLTGWLANNNIDASRRDLCYVDYLYNTDGYKMENVET